MAAAKVLRELGGRSRRGTNAAAAAAAAWVRRLQLGGGRRDVFCDDRPSIDQRRCEMAHSIPALFPSGAGARHHRCEAGKLRRTAGWEPATGRSFVAFSRIAPSSTQSAPQFAETEPGSPEEEKNKKAVNKSLGARMKTLFSELERVPVGALGLGLAGALPFVGLTPGIATLLPLPEGLGAIHVEAQAAYGAVILTFLGGPHWGLAMADNASPSSSTLSRQTVRTVRYVWSVVPSLVAWVALLLNPVPKLALLITSFGLVLSVDAIFAWIGLLPSWYMPLRVLLTGIAMLSLTSSLIVTAATNVVTQ